MPRTPILDRETYYYQLPDGTYADFDWNIVNTSLGAMVESRPLLRAPGDNFEPVDLIDASFNRRRAINPDQFFALTGHNGLQLPVDHRR